MLGAHRHLAIARIEQPAAQQPHIDRRAIEARRPAQADLPDACRAEIEVVALIENQPPRPVIQLDTSIYPNFPR
jgi:hypothetical protein